LFGEVLADVFQDRKILGGAPFNVARHLQAFGAHPVLITRTGNDELRRELLDLMAAAGMDGRGIQLDRAHPTGQAIVSQQEGEHRFELLEEQAYDYIHAGMAQLLVSKVRPMLVYFGTLAQRSAKSALALTALLRSTTAARFLDLNLRTPWFDTPTIERSLRRTNTLKVNQDELDELTSLFSLSGENEQKHAADLIRRFSLNKLLVTCGEQGAWQLDRRGELVHVDGSSVADVVDTVGAGDGFAAICILGQLRRWPSQLTLTRANAFAAVLCGIRGAIPDDSEFYEPFRKDWKT